VLNTAVGVAVREFLAEYYERFDKHDQMSFPLGAFLDVQWRRNDIMWGRLDGCERLLDALFPETNDSVRSMDASSHSH
jgi:Protein of unknown function (DUF3376)